MNACSTRILKGNRPVVEATFRDEDQALANPGALTVTTRDPSGDQAVYSTPNANITNPSVGVWRFTFPTTLTETGKWWVVVQGTAGLEAASEIWFEVRGSHVSV